jgi:hypothetical protein
MKSLILLVSFWFSAQALAAPCPEGNCPTDSVVQPSATALKAWNMQWSLQNSPPPKAQITEVLAALKIVDRNILPPSVSKPEKVTDPTGCNEFISGNTYGAFGRAMEKDFKDGRYKSLLNGNQDMGQICPNYQYLPQDYKIAVRVLERTMQARFESTCRPHVDAPGINGTATGLFQLHKSHEGIYSRECRNGDGHDARRSIRCTSSMLNELVEEGHNIYKFDSHWAVLEPQNSIIPRGFSKNAALTTMAAVCQISFCGAVPSYCKAVVKTAQDVARQLSGRSPTKGHRKTRVAGAASAR